MLIALFKPVSTFRNLLNNQVPKHRAKSKSTVLLAEPALAILQLQIVGGMGAPSWALRP